MGANLQKANIDFRRMEMDRGGGRLEYSGPWTGTAELEERERMCAQTTWGAELGPGEVGLTVASPKYCP